MKNVYKTRLYRVLLNVVFGLAAALLVGFIASIWLHVLVLQVLICAAVFAFYVWTVIIGNMIVIETDGTTLTVKKGKKHPNLRLKSQQCGEKRLLQAAIPSVRCILPGREKMKKS